MEYLWAIFIFIIVFVRFIAPYDSRYMNEKHACIKNPILRVLLLDKSSFLKSDRRKNDINQISLIGIVLYVYAIISALLSILSYIFISKTKVEPWIIQRENGDIVIDTLNECYSAGFILSFLALVFFCVGIRFWQYGNKCKGKCERLLLNVFSLIVMAVSVALVIPLLF